MKLFKLGFWSFIVCILIHNSMAQDFEVLAPSGEIIEPIFDNRSIAMGNTAITTSRSSSAIFSNPSILATFSKSQVQMGGKVLYGTTTNEAANIAESYDSYEFRYSLFPNRSYLTLAVPYRLPHRHLPRPRDWQLVFGVGYQRNEGVRWESEAVWLEEEWAETKGELVDIHVTSNRNGRRRGDLSTLTPGIALNLQDRYFFGLTFNRTLGAVISTNEWKRPDHHTKVDSEQKQSALFLRIGALAKVTPELSMSLMYRPGFDWELRETITKTYEDGELETDRNRMYAKLAVPAMWGIGVAYKVSPEFAVALELQSRPFSELRWSGDFNQRLFIDDGLNFSVGAEYLGAGFPLRFGAFRDVIPFVDENDTAPVSLVGLTAGLGSNGDKNFSWDASALFGTWEQVNDEGQKYSENLIRAGISATYRFNTVLGMSSTN